MKLSIVPGTYSILRFNPNEVVPAWAFKGEFYSVSKTQTELSVVCESCVVETGFIKRNEQWACIKVEGTLDFSLTGILSAIARPLAEAKVSIFAISTFDTDYILVKEEKLLSAQQVLTANGFTW